MFKTVKKKRPIVKQGIETAGDSSIEGFDLSDYPFLDPEYNKQIDPATKAEIDAYPFVDSNKVASLIGPTETYWTDAFIYWIDEPLVQEASFISFFHEMSAERSENSLCYEGFVSLKNKWIEFRNDTSEAFTQEWF